MNQYIIFQFQTSTQVCSICPFQTQFCFFHTKHNLSISNNKLFAQLTQVLLPFSNKCFFNYFKHIILPTFKHMSNFKHSFFYNQCTIKMSKPLCLDWQFDFGHKNWCQLYIVKGKNSNLLKLKCNPIAIYWFERIHYHVDTI